MKGKVIEILGHTFGDLRQYVCRFPNLDMEDADMRKLKVFFLQLKFLACTAVVTTLFFIGTEHIVADEIVGLEALMELDPLDCANIDPPKVVEDCTRALAINSKSKLRENQICHLLFTRGVAQSFLGKNEEAIRDLTEVLRRQPNDCRTLRLRGQIYCTLKQYDNAHSDFEAVVKHQPKSGIGYACLALYFGEVGDYGSSKKFAEKAIVLDPEDPQGYLTRSQANLKEHNLKEALKDINQCITLSYGGGTSASAVPFQMRAAIFSGFFDNPKKAFPDLLMACSIDPYDDTTKGMFCEYYFKMGKYNMAFHISEQLVKKHARRPDLLGRRAYCLLEHNRPEEALRLTNSMISDASRWWGSYLCRGVVFFTERKYREALRDYDKSLALLHDNFGAIAAKAYLLAACPESQLRDGPAARTLAIKCCERTEYQVPRQLMVLAMACAECGDYKEAVRWAKKSIEKADATFPFLEDYRQRLALFEKGKPYRFSPDARVFDYLW